MLKQFLLAFVLLFFVGCSSLTFQELDSSNPSEDKLLSCEKKAKAKSLQLLEQKYRCTGQK